MAIEQLDRASVGRPITRGGSIALPHLYSRRGRH